jgi:hypothetical protein
MHKLTMPLYLCYVGTIIEHTEESFVFIFGKFECARLICCIMVGL